MDHDDHRENIGEPPNDWLDPDGCGSPESPAACSVRIAIAGRLGWPIRRTPLPPDAKPLDRELDRLPGDPTVSWGAYIRLSRTVRRAWANLTPTDTVVWTYLALKAAYRPVVDRGYSLAAGEAFCPVAQVAKHCGMTRVTVRRALATLEQNGWIMRRSAAGPGGVAIITIAHYAELAQAGTDYVLLHRCWLRSCLWRQEPAVVKVALDHLLAVNFTVTRDDRLPQMLDAGQARRPNASICKSCGVSPSTVVHAHRVLAEIGFIEPVIHTPGSRVPSLITVRWYKSCQSRSTDRSMARVRDEDREARSDAEQARLIDPSPAPFALPVTTVGAGGIPAGGSTNSGHPDDAGTPSGKGSVNDQGGFDRYPPEGSVNDHPGGFDRYPPNKKGDSPDIRNPEKETSATCPHMVRAVERGFSSMEEKEQPPTKNQQSGPGEDCPPQLVAQKRSVSGVAPGGVMADAVQPVVAAVDAGDGEWARNALEGLARKRERTAVVTAALAKIKEFLRVCQTDPTRRGEVPVDKVALEAAGMEKELDDMRREMDATELLLKLCPAATVTPGPAQPASNSCGKRRLVI